MKKISTSFSRARATRAFPCKFDFLLSQPSPSPCKIGGEFSYVPHFFLGNIFRRFFAQNHRLCEGCESEKTKISVMRARVTRARVSHSPPFLASFSDFPSRTKKNLPRSNRFLREFSKNSNVFQKISNVFQKISNVFQRISNVFQKISNV